MTRGFVMSALMGCAALRRQPFGAASEGRGVHLGLDRRFCFRPRELSVTVGTMVVFVNHDRLPHSVVGALGEKEEFRSDGQLDQDESFAVVLDEPGLIEVTCGIHSRMRARLTVTR